MLPGFFFPSLDILAPIALFSSVSAPCSPKGFLICTTLKVTRFTRLDFL